MDSSRASHAAFIDQSANYLRRYQLLWFTTVVYISLAPLKFKEFFRDYNKPILVCESSWKLKFPKIYLEVLAEAGKGTRFTNNAN